MTYYAVRPKSIPNHIRIEKAATPREALQTAFGRGYTKGAYEFKDLGTRVKVIQSDNKRIAMLLDPQGWSDI